MENFQLKTRFHTKTGFRFSRLNRGGDTLLLVCAVVTSAFVSSGLLAANVIF